MIDSGFKAYNAKKVKLSKELRKLADHNKSGIKWRPFGYKIDIKSTFYRPAKLQADFKLKMDAAFALINMNQD